MIDIKVQRVPDPCPACKTPAEEAESVSCTRCKRVLHSACWAESGCTVCPPLEGKAPEPTPEPAHTSGHHGHRLPPGEEPHWLDKTENLKKMAKVVYVLCAGLIVIEVLGSLEIGYHKHGHEKIGTDTAFGFYPIAGAVAYTLVVILGVGLQKLVQRREGYYDD